MSDSTQTNYGPQRGVTVQGTPGHQSISQAFTSSTYIPETSTVSEAVRNSMVFDSPRVPFGSMAKDAENNKAQLWLWVDTNGIILATAAYCKEIMNQLSYKSSPVRIMAVSGGSRIIKVSSYDKDGNPSNYKDMGRFLKGSFNTICNDKSIWFMNQKTSTTYEYIRIQSIYLEYMETVNIDVPTRKALLKYLDWFTESKTGFDPVSISSKTLKSLSKSDPFIQQTKTDKDGIQKRFYAVWHLCFPIYIPSIYILATCMQLIFIKYYQKISCILYWFCIPFVY